MRGSMRTVSGYRLGTVDLVFFLQRQGNPRAAGMHWLKSTLGSIVDLAYNMQRDAQVDRMGQVLNDDASKVAENLHRKSSQDKSLP